MTLLPVVIGLGYAGWVLISLSMNRHSEQLLGRRLSARNAEASRLLGFSVLAASAGLSMTHWGPWIGLLGVWGGVLSLTAGLYVFLLPYAPRMAFRLGVALPVIGLCALSL